MYTERKEITKIRPAYWRKRNKVIKKVLLLIGLATFTFLGLHTPVFENLFRMQDNIGPAIAPWILVVTAGILLFRKR